MLTYGLKYVVFILYLNIKWNRKMITEKDVQYIADLSRISLRKEEVGPLTKKS